MSDTFDHLDASDDGDDGQPVGIPRKDLKALRERSRRLAEAEQRAEEAERRLAFSEAGISTSDPKLAYFVKGYEGELTADAIRQAALDAGFIEDKSGAGSGSGATDAELETQRRIDAATGGADTLTPDREAERDAKLKAARTAAEFDAIALEYGTHYA